MVQDKRKAKIQATFDVINKQFGIGSVCFLNQKPKISTSVIPSSIPALNIALGIGGLPRKRIIEIYGQESSGKTTISLDFAAQAQKQGELAAIIDAEHAIDPEYARLLGVDTDNLIVSQPDTGEEALEIAEALVRSGEVGLIIVDSVAALVPKAEIDGEMGQSHIGLQARLMSQGLRKLGAVVSVNNCCVIFINQIREKIGVMFGNPETTPGGRALKFWSSIRIEVRSSKIDSGPYKGAGNTLKFKIVKNKVAAPYKTAEGTLIWGEGFSYFDNLMDALKHYGLVIQNGPWYRMGDYTWQRTTFSDENQAIAEALLESAIAEDVGGVVIPSPVEDEDFEKTPTDEFLEELGVNEDN